jgi:molybdate transport system permease protein
MRACSMFPLLLVFAASLADSTSGAQNAEQRPSSLLLAAASTTDAIEDIVRQFEAAHPTLDVRTSFGASSTLAQQIVAGARADLFLSASTQWADTLAEKNLVAKRQDLLGNRLVVIVPKDSTLRLAAPQDLVADNIQRLALADPAAVPAGVYAREALEKLGLWQQLAPRVAAGADVRQALDFVATGAADAGIIYASDVASQDQVQIACEFPAAFSQSIRYPLVLLKDAGPAAEKLYEFLSTPAAAEVFERHGFVVLTTTPPTAPRAIAPPAAAKAVAHRGWLSSDERQALRLSLQVGVVAVLVSLPLAVFAGYYLAQRASPGKWLVELAVNLPLVLPPVVTGYLLLVLFAPRGPIGAALEDWFGVRIVFTWIGAALAAAVVSFPLMVRAIRLAFQSIDPRLEMAARSLGATRAGAFWSISLPLARRGVLAGCILAFARSLGEFGATIMIAGNIVGETQTIPLAIFSSANRPGGEAEVWRLVALSVVLAASALAVSEWLERRHTAREAA